MFKTLRKVALVTVLSVGALGAQAQFNVGAAIAFNKFGNDLGSFPAFQPRIGYDFREGRVGLSAGFNYSPTAASSEGTLSASDGTRTSTIEVPITQDIHIQNYFFHGHYRFGNPENKFHFGLLGGISVDLISIKYQKAELKTGYTFDSDFDYKDVSTGGPKLDFGFSGDYRVGRGSLFAEFILGLPANEKNGQYFDNPAVTHVGMWLGYKFIFGENNNY